MSQTETQRSWRAPNPHRPPHHQDGKPSGGVPELPIIPATRFFDNLSYVGDEFVGCFVLETSEGLILLDCMFPDADTAAQVEALPFPSMRYANILENGLRDIGLNPYDIKLILVTHGHCDHYGNGDYYRKKYGCRVLMSETDEAFGTQKIGRSPRGWLDWKADEYLLDGGKVTLGTTTVHTFVTPGHTPGCMSFIFDVYDEGRRHAASLWGGTGIPKEDEWKQAYLNSTRRYTKICDQMGVDVAVSTHPFTDNSSQRLALCRDIFDGVPNPYVIGRQACRRFEAMFEQLCLSKMREHR